MKKYLLFLLILLTSVSYVFSQINEAVFSPASGSYWYGSSTEINFTFKRNGQTIATPPGCGIGVTFGGAGVQGINYNNPNKFFTVYWGGNPDNSNFFSLSVYNCTSNVNNSTLMSGSYSVMALTGVNPVKATTGGTSVPICNPGTITYSVNEVSIPNGGTRKASNYQWTLPAGWKFPDGSVSNGSTPKLLDANSRTITVTPDCKTGGAVVVRAFTNTEGLGTPHYSNPTTWNVSRTPDVSLSLPAKIYCGVPFTASVTPLTCVSAGAYTWNIPSGWQISGSGNTRTITPTNTSTGTITASIALPNNCSISKSTTRQPTKELNVSGGPIAYTGSSVTLSNYPIGASVSWSIISNSGLFTTGTRNGTGNVANLIPINSSASGSATIRFTITGGACNYLPKEYTFYVGRPSFSLFYLQNSFYNSEQGPGGGFEVSPSTLVNMRPAFATDLAGIIEYEWEIVGSYNSVISTSSPIFSFISSSSENVLANVYLRMRNSVGWSTKQSSHMYTRGDGYEPERVYPSPAKDEITVQSYPEDEQLEMSKLYPRLKTTIRIMDSMGNQVLERINAKPIEKIKVSHLKKGYYIVHIIKGDKVVVKKIQVQ